MIYCLAVALHCAGVAAQYNGGCDRGTPGMAAGFFVLSAWGADRRGCLLSAV